MLLLLLNLTSVPIQSSAVRRLLLQLLLLLLLKEVGSERLGGADLHPIIPQTPAPKYQPLDRKKRKGRIVESNK